MPGGGKVLTSIPEQLRGRRAGRVRPWWIAKPMQNQRNMVPKPLFQSRNMEVPLLPRVTRLVQAGVIPRPLWLDTAIAHPPPIDSAKPKRNPTRLAWRDDDLLRRMWQRRNPQEAAAFAKVMFLDEQTLPVGTRTDHPADEFVRKQSALVRRGFSETEAYRRVKQQMDQKRKATDDIAAARAQASALGVEPAESPGSVAADGNAKPKTPAGFAEQLLRRFAEEARDANQPYPQHWFGSDGEWNGIGDVSQLNARTRSMLSRTGRQTGLFDGMTFRDSKQAANAAADAEAEADASLDAEEEGSPVDGDDGEKAEEEAEKPR